MEKKYEEMRKGNNYTTYQKKLNPLNFDQLMENKYEKMKADKSNNLPFNNKN